MTPYESPQWQGATVAVIGTAKSATPEALEAVRGMVELRPIRPFCWCRTLTCWCRSMRTGRRRATTSGHARGGRANCDKDAAYVGVDYERVQLSPSEVVHFRNNGMLAIRLAVRAGAKKIVLVGFDPQSYQATQDAGGYDFRGYAEGLEQLIAQVRAGGVEVVHASEADAPSRRSVK
jgi:hypothetical protein